MVQSSDLLYTFMDNDFLMQGFDWMWAWEQMSKGDPSLPSFFGNHMYHFRYPVPMEATKPCHFGIQQKEETNSYEEGEHIVNLKVATFNVLTLETRKEKWIGTGSTSRHLSLLKQCDEQGLHIVGVQETRAGKTTNRVNPYYQVITSPCRPDGHYGVQIWLHHSRSFAEGQRPFKADDYRIIYANPNVLAVKLTHPALHCIVIAARAPTSEKPIAEIKEFWTSITSSIMAKFLGWKVILLCDSNSHVGSCTSTSISSYGREHENPAGEVFHDWLLQHSIWLPSTWENIHKGDHFTFVTPNGQHQHRLDFVGLSQNWHLDFVSTSVAADIGSLSRCDHLAVLCSFKAKVSVPHESCSTRKKNPSLDHGRISAAGAQHYSLAELPTLFEIEQTCRKTTLGRAAGLDMILPEICRNGASSISRHIHNLIMKITCNQTEPIWYKGGLICPIYKAKGPLDDCLPKGSIVRHLREEISCLATWTSSTSTTRKAHPWPAWWFAKRADHDGFTRTESTWPVGPQSSH